MTAIRSQSSGHAPWSPEQVDDGEAMLEPVARGVTAKVKREPTRRPAAEVTPDPAPGAVVAVARSYEDIVDACRTRRQELKLSQLVVDDLAGLQSGYCGKIECHDKRLGAMSMPCLLQALGLELIVVRTIPHHLRRAAA